MTLTKSASTLTGALIRERKMRHLLSLGAVLLLLGCGSYQIGKANQQQQDGGNPGGSPNENGGSHNGTGGSSGGGAIGKGGAMGGGGSTGQCDPGSCAVPAVCQVCPDGTYSCAKADCIDGKCQTVFEPCGGGGVGGSPGVECVANTDCVQVDAPCQLCPDGTTACPSVECIAGKCVGTFPFCGGRACDPTLCPVPPPNAKPCCLSTSGPCGVDFLDSASPPTARAEAAQARCSGTRRAVTQCVASPDRAARPLGTRRAIRLPDKRPADRAIRTAPSATRVTRAASCSCAPRATPRTEGSAPCLARSSRPTSST
jgi:hypothetical protein